MCFVLPVTPHHELMLASCCDVLTLPARRWTQAIRLAVACASGMYLSRCMAAGTTSLSHVLLRKAAGTALIGLLCSCVGAAMVVLAASAAPYVKPARTLLCCSKQLSVEVVLCVVALCELTSCCWIHARHASSPVGRRRNVLHGQCVLVGWFLLWVCV